MYIQLIIIALILPIYNCQIDFQTICQAGIRQDNTNYIHCGRKQLDEIPNFSRTTNTFYDELVLNDNHVIEIRHGAFQGLRVKRLNLSGNKIRFVDSRAFVELANYLEELIIEFDPNILHEIPNAIKYNLINLRSLKLINLNLTVIKNNTFVKYRKLEDLSITKSNIKSIESNALNSLSNLRSLHLDHNQLTDQIWFDLTKYLTNLEILTLSQNNLNILKENFPLKNLKFLDLSSNGIQIIEKNFFENMLSIEKLYLQNNELNSLQLTFLTAFSHLKELNLDFNRLTFIPENLFHNNNKLTYLSLQGNDLNYLTNKSFRGLKNLIYLNLARNRLQFHVNQQPFQDLNSLELLNLDRNVQLNLSRNSFHGIEANLIDLSLQNCNLTSIQLLNNPFHSFVNLQRLRLSSNNLKELPENFLINAVGSLMSIDLQRNLFRSIPTLFGRDATSSKLTDFDLSSNHVCTLDKDDLYKYTNLKTIGLTGNPLHCDCNLRWLKQWLIKNYDYDLIKFLQWTCATPMSLHGQQLTIIDESDMICSKDHHSQCQDAKSSTTTKSTSTQLTSIRSTSTSSSTSSIRTTIVTTTTFDELIINDISYNPNGMLTITWECMLSIVPRYFHLQIYDETYRNAILQRLIDGDQRSIEINIKDYLREFSSKYMICLNIRHQKYCRDIQIQQIKSSSLILSSSKTDDNQISYYLYALIVILLAAVLVCFILILVCCWRIRRLSKQTLSTSTEKLPSNTLYHPPPRSSIFYRPLNIISYPQQQQQQVSCNTSECSTHSSTDTSQLPNDSYHIYQQIPPVYNCQMHPTRTHVLI